MIKGYKSEILKEYEKIRENESLALKNRRKEIKIKLPKVPELEEEIAKLSIEMSINILKNPDKSEEYVNIIKNKITDLRVKKSELLVSNGYDMDFLEMHYNCNKCKDTGFVNNKKCSCYKQKLIKLYYRNSDLKHILKTNNFSNFNFEYFTNEKTDFHSDTPRKNIEKILNKMWHFIENFNKTDENFMFIGTAGTGKTFLSNCIAKELLDRGNFVVYRTADELIQNLRSIKFSNDKHLEDILINCDLLIIDDLGTESINEFSKVELFNFINKKLFMRKKMIISSNYSIESILKNYSERISSRLLGNFTLFKFYCDDIRIQKNIQKK
ncbi:ATP-binding protein [Clostridium sporogenes]|uniref:DNA replication protein DnaC n=2 Tax=Clostridium TaxID=1485 RepID=A0A6M0T582_CLOBO|nr:ATP-binding protein [Clostridium sporogenes]NFA61952.1 DNA replication protein DnaC [Clostridium botulinum]MDS1004869.1 ATP-binding protein [Clostridium sporogenes]NFI75117.1 DNA replication protein DnaC [Clostridium sporogenes]NFL72053.1 DNA replication protein DnaC [Clostridium sporogenes]NFM25085.1 DNA replication protein DnaC [Clostridium sporogenes]